MAAICFVIISVFFSIVTIVAQPTSLRHFSPYEREMMTLETQERVDKLTQQIRHDKSNIALYKERLRLYYNLIELNYDNNDWELYADKFEADLSHIIQLEGTAEAFKERGSFVTERIRRSQPPKEITELYPRNRYIDQSASDYLEAIRRTSDPLMLVSIYTALSDLYTLRPQKLVSAPNFPKWRNRIQLKPILNDFEIAVKYIRKALEIGAKQPYANVLTGNLIEIYVRNADTAFKLEAYQIALELNEVCQTILKQYSLVSDHWKCPYYVGWGKVYLKLNNPDKALEKFNSIPINGNDYCTELLLNRGDAFAAKGEFEKALSDYDKSLTYDKSDSLKRNGWLYLKRAKLYLQYNKAEQALADLSVAIEKKYIAACPQVYQLRAEVYRKLGKPESAADDIKTANKLKNQTDCMFNQ